MADNDSPMDVALEIDKVASVVATARRLLAEGKMVDLSALEDKVRAICEAIRMQPQDEPEHLQEAMRAAIGDLDKLAEDLRDRFGAVLTASAATNTAQATAAYRRPRDET